MTRCHRKMVPGVTIKKISFKPTNRRSSHPPAGQDRTRMCLTRGRVTSGQQSIRPRWHRFSAPTGGAGRSAGEPSGELAGYLDRAWLPAVAQDGQRDLVRSGVKMLADPRSDRVGAAPGHQVVDEPVAEAGDVAVRESHPGEVGAVPAYTGQEAQRAAGSPAGTCGVGVKDDHLVDDERGLVAQDAPRCSGVGGRDQKRYGTGGPVPGELKLAGSERGQD